jgi:hypothetical protein
MTYPLHYSPWEDDAMSWVITPGWVPADARFAFYSIGESLNLTALDARVTDLINAFGVAIP